MAEVTGLRNNALPYPVYGVPFGITFPLLDADGDPVSPSSPDSERSLNGDTFADCTNEATEIATSSGICYLLLTAAEMTADVVTVRIQSTGAKTTVMTLYPRKLVSLRSGTVGANAADGTTLQLDSSAVAIDDYYNGCVVVGTIDTVVEARMIGDYVGSTKVCTVAGPAFNTAPDNNDTFVVYQPESRQINQSDNVGWAATVLPSPDTAGYPKVTIKDGTGTGEIDTTSGGVLVAAIAANAITATSIASDAITDAKVASDVTIASVTGAVGSVTGAVGSVTGNVGGNVTGSVGSVAAGGITASSIAADAIGASELAADAVSEIAAAISIPTAAAIADAVWDEDATAHQTTGTFGQAIGDPGASTETLYKAIVTDPAGTNIAADVIALKAETAAILDDTDDIGVAGAGLTDLGGMSTTMKGQVQTEAEDALVVHRLDEILNADSDIDGAAPPTVGSVIHELMSKTAGSFTYDQTTDSQEAIRDKLTDIETDTAEIGAAGAGLTNINLPNQTMDIVGNITGDLSGSVGSVTGAVGSVTGNVGGNVTGSVGSVAAGGITASSIAADAIGASELAADAATEIATAVWASATRTLSALGFTLGASDLAADTIGASELATDAISEIVSAVWTTALTESYNSDGAAPTPAQAMFVIMQRLVDFAISGTSIAVKGLDGTTTKYTLTLDDATNPTSSSRAT